MKQLFKLKKSFLSYAAVSLPCAINVAYAGAGMGASNDIGGTQTEVPTFYANTPSGVWTDWRGMEHDSGASLRKFVDELPGLGAAGANSIGQYVPVGKPDTSTFPGSDYYEIAIVEYTEKMHSDLPKATRLRGYVQLATSNVPGTATITAGGKSYSVVDKPHYLGPTIVAERNRPVRIKYINLLPSGDLFLPVDETLQGAGIGPDGFSKYSQTRASVHLHGGDNPWISDGTPHQWVASALENTKYKKGASQRNVPDMWFNPLNGYQVVPASQVPADPVAAGLSNDPGPGAGTLFYPNGMGARLMWYHDHAIGLTRVNVYAGMAAGYIIREPAVEALLPHIPGGEIPLIIQDKTFIPKDIAIQDAKWDGPKWGQYGDLWFPHVYEFNQDPNSADGTNPPGRWDYGPYFWPIFPAPLALPGGNYGDVSTTPEAFMDTPIVNGTPYPKMVVEPTAHRLRILNATNDRTLNLGLYVADPTVITEDGRTNTEIKMVQFDSSYKPQEPNWGFPETGGLMGTGWGKPDGRLGGIPDPAFAGPDIIQIGNEGGFLPEPVTIPSTPVNFEYNRRSVTVLNVMEHGLYMMSAERADVVVDFSQYAGKTLLVYNDGPAPNPAGDPRVDYYTNNPDQTDVGGATSTKPGYGPNTRTVMQIEVGAGNQPIKDISVINGGANYVNPTITIEGGDPATPATAVANLAYSVNQVNLQTQGNGYSNPKVAFVGGSPTRSALAEPVLSGPINANITITSGGSGYDPNNPPVVRIVDQDPSNPNSTNPTATAHIAAGDIVMIPVKSGGTIDQQDPTTYTYSISKITLDNPGSGYNHPIVEIGSGQGTANHASAMAVLEPTQTKIAKIKVTDTGAGYKSAPTLAIVDATGTGASALVDMNAGSIASIKLTNPGSGYKTAPKIIITDAQGAGAITSANFAPKAAWNAAQLDTALPRVYAASQPKPVVPEAAFNSAFGTNYVDTHATIFTGSLNEPVFSFTAPAELTYTTLAAAQLTGPLTYVINNGDTVGLGAGQVAQVPTGTRVTVAEGTNVKMPVQNKAIQELFDPHGRMNATLGVELPFTSALTQTTIPLNYVDPATEVISDGETQIWKITHNGVDTHPVHFHLVNVQLINRVGWDGTRKTPDANEMGWKETVKMNPLEDVIVAVRAKAPMLPFSISGSKRLMDPAQPVGGTFGFTQIDPFTNNPMTVTNEQADYGWEYAWHCHILGHEENDFMRPIVFTGATNYNTADTTAPQVNYQLAPAENAAGWVNKDVSVGISGTDNPAPNGSGMATLTYSAGGAQPVAETVVKAGSNESYSITSQEKITTEGTTTFSAFGTDQAAIANISFAQTKTVKLDKTAPETNYTQTPAANAKGWNNSKPVSFSWAISDALSGLTAQSPASSNGTVNVEGKTATPTLSVSDVAGNALTLNKTINIDVTPPTVSGKTVAPAANANGWNNSNVTVTLTGSDALSGIASCEQIVVSTEGTNQSVSGKCTDNADNVTNGSVSGINIDKTAPVLTWTTTAVAKNGWYKTLPLSVTWKASDALSGLVSPQAANQAITGTARFTVAGANQTRTPTLTTNTAFTGFVDKAGNNSTRNLQSTPFSIDNVAPVIAWTKSPAANATGWNNTDVSMSWQVSDALSGVDPNQLTGQANSGTVLLAVNTSATGQTVKPTLNTGFTGWLDLAGNSLASTATSVTSAAVKIDKSAPTVLANAPTAGVNAAGWYKANVTVTCARTEVGSSGLKTGAAYPATVSVSTEGTNTVTCNAADNADNTASNAVQIKLDKTVPVASTPTVTTGTKGAGPSYSIPVTVSGSVSDVTSGVVSATYKIARGTTTLVNTTNLTLNNGSYAVTNSVTGTSAASTYTVTVIVTDNAGLVTTKTATFSK